MIHAFLVTLAVLAAIRLFPLIFVLTGGIGVLVWKGRYVLLSLVAAIIGFAIWDYQVGEAKSRQWQQVWEEFLHSVYYQPPTDPGVNFQTVTNDQYQEFLRHKAATQGR